MDILNPLELSINLDVKWLLRILGIEYLVTLMQSHSYE